MKWIPLSFSVAYNGLITGRSGIENQMEEFNLLMWGLKPKDTGAYDDNRVSKYVRGKESITKELRKNFRNLSMDEIVRRLELLNIGMPEIVVKKFHAFYESEVISDNERTKNLEKLIEENKYHHYIATVLLFSLDYKGKQKEWLSDDLIDRLIELSDIPHAIQKTIKIDTFNNLPPRNDFFIGRKKELLMLEANFQNEHNVQLIQGMGGFGKTQLAIEYAHKHKKEYSSIIFVDASSRNTILAQYRFYLSNKHCLPQEITASSIQTAFKNAMESIGDWLIIYDNCDYNDQGFGDFLKSMPSSQTNGHIIITTRLNRTFGKAPQISIRELSDEESSSFLCERTGIGDNREAAKLAGELGNYPLALELAGAYISATPGISFSSYYDRLQDNILILERKVDTSIYDKTIGSIILTTIEKIKDDKGNDTISRSMHNILAILSLMHHSNIDMDLLKYLTPVPGHKPENDIADLAYQQTEGDAALSEIAGIFRDDLERDDFIRTAVKYSLIRCENNKFSMHPLQQQIILSLCSKDTVRNSAFALSAATLATIPLVTYYKYGDYEAVPVTTGFLPTALLQYWNHVTSSRDEADWTRFAFEIAVNLIYEVGRIESYAELTEAVRKTWFFYHPKFKVFTSSANWKIYCDDHKKWETDRNAEINSDPNWLKELATCNIDNPEDIVAAKKAYIMMDYFSLMSPEVHQPYPDGMEIPTCLDGFEGAICYPEGIKSDWYNFTVDDDGGLFSDKNPIGKKFTLRQSDGVFVTILVKNRESQSYQSMDADSSGEWKTFESIGFEGTGYLSDYQTPIERGIILSAKTDRINNITICFPDETDRDARRDYLFTSSKWSPFLQHLIEQNERADRYIHENILKIYPQLVHRIDELKQKEADVQNGRKH